MIHCSSIGFRKKNDCLLLLMGGILTLTIPSCFLLSFYFISALHSTKQHLWILINIMSVLVDTGDLQKLFPICCQFLGKRNFCKEKHQENRTHSSDQYKKQQSFLTSTKKLPEMPLCYVCYYQKQEHTNNICLQKLD